MSRKIQRVVLDLFSTESFATNFGGGRGKVAFPKRRNGRAVTYCFDDAIFALHERRAGFDPVTTVVIRDATKSPDRNAVNVPAQNCVNGIVFRVADNGGLKFSDETDGLFYALFHVIAQRPIAENEP